MQSISTLARTLLIAAALVTASVVLLSAFGAGFMAQIQRDAADPTAAPVQLLKSIDALEASLGHSGFLAQYRLYRARGAASAINALHKQTANAQNALTVIELQVAAARAPNRPVADIRAIVAVFVAASDAAARPVAAPDLAPADLGPSIAELEAAYGNLRLETARIRQSIVAARIDALTMIFAWGQWIVLVALLVLVFGFLVVGLFLSRSVINPLRQLYSSLATAGQGNLKGEVWGAERPDEIGAVARAADRLRATLAEAPNLSALANDGRVQVKLEGPASVLFEKLMAEIGSATQQLQNAAESVAQSGGAGREQLGAATNRLAAVTAEVAGFTHGARSDVKDAVDAMRGAASSVMASGQHVQGHVAQLTARFVSGGDQLATTAGQVSERVTTALAELAAASEGLRMSAQDARANQSTVTAFTYQASSQTAEALGLLQSAGLNLKAALTSMEDRMSRALQSVSRLTESLSSSANSLNSATEESSRRLAAAAKDLEGRSVQAEMRLGLTLDEAGQQVRANVHESAALKIALAQALDDLRAARSGLESAHGAQGADLTNVLSAVQDLQSLLVQQSAAPGHTTPDSPETTVMPASVKISRLNQAAKLPIAAADMLARLGSIAAEVRAAAGHDLTGLRSTLQDFRDAVMDDAQPIDGATVCRFADALDAEAATLSATLAELRASTDALVDGLRHGAAETVDGRVSVAAQAEKLLAEIDAVERLEAPTSMPVQPVLADTLETTAQDIQRLSDLIADLEMRAEMLAQEALDGSAPEAETGAPSERSDSDRMRADAQTDEAIQAVFQSIERLNNIAQALARAGDFKSQRRIGD